MVKGFDQIKLDGVEAILLDLDNTLYDYDTSHKHALKICSDKFTNDNNSTKEEFLNLYAEARSQTHQQLKGQAASHSRLIYFQKLLEIYHKQTMFGLSLYYEELYWSSFMDKMELFPEALRLLKNAQEKNIDICVVTDLTAQIQARKINKLQINQYIKYLVSSEEVGMEKPAAAIFKLALDKLGKSESSVIMVGDSQEKDIDGAQALGIQAYLVTG